MNTDYEISEKSRKILDTVFTPDMLNRNGGDMSRNAVVNLVRQYGNALHAAFDQGELTMAPNRAALEALSDLADYSHDLLRLRGFADKMTKAHITGDQEALGALTNKINRLNTFHQRYYHGSDLPVAETPIGMLAQVFEAASEHPAHTANVKLDSHNLARTYRETVRQPGNYELKGKGSSAPDVNKDAIEKKMKGSGGKHLNASSRISGVMKKLGL